MEVIIENLKKIPTTIDMMDVPNVTIIIEFFTKANFGTQQELLNKAGNLSD